MLAYLVVQTFTVTGRWSRQGNGLTAIETKLSWMLSAPATGLSCGSTSINAEESSVYEEFALYIVFRNGR